MNHDTDEPTNHEPPTFGKAGTGKTHQIITELAHRFADDPDFEWIDPKGDPRDNTTGGDP